VYLIICPYLFVELRHGRDEETELKQQRHFMWVVDLVEEHYLELSQSLFSFEQVDFPAQPRLDNKIAK
jgi:hypothetical protein